MAVPKVVIVGRPNVGKSSLLNWLAGIRIAIVEDRPGVTRDRVDYLMEYKQRYFELIDTGGIGILDEDNLTQHIDEQIQVAIDSAAAILFVVDSRDGLLPLDEEVARRLRHVDVPVICVANKADTLKLDNQAADFYRLGRGKIIPVKSRSIRNSQQRARNESGHRRKAQCRKKHFCEYTRSSRTNDRERNCGNNPR
jgi:GTP-binding protein